MPRTRGRARRAAPKSDETPKASEMEKPSVPEEQVDFDGDNEETVEEEDEYEEVEEEVEEEEEEEVEEEVEVEEEEEEEDDPEEEEEEADAQQRQDGDEEMEAADDEDVKKKHAELLSLPPHGSEVYLGGIPLDASEEDLKEFCESVGEVTEVRIMRGKDSTENKGFAFVTFRTNELASAAIEELNNTQLKGRRIKCSTSQAKHKLFIGNVPKNWTVKDIKKVVSAFGPGITSVELLKDPQNSRRNRGFAFIEYYNHACAEYSRQKMLDPKFKLDDNAPTVSWADPKNAESSASSQVKAVYVKNLPKNVSQDQLKRLFECHGTIKKVVLPPAKAGHERSRFGFVHFSDRSSVMKALKNTEKYELDGQVLECSLAKPQADQKLSGGPPSSHKAALLPSNRPHVDYGLVGGAYGALAPGYGGPGFGQQLIYGGGPSPAGMAMMPMLLPDGRIAYVLQQPGAPLTPPPPPPRGSGGRSSGGGGRSVGGGGSGRSGGGGGRSGGKGSSSSGAQRRGSDSGGRGRSRYNPY